MSTLLLAEHGAEHVPAAFSPDDLAALEAVLTALPPERAGIRITCFPELAPFLAASGLIGIHAAQRLGTTARPVRAIFFDKTPGTNWALGWHQDRTIAVRERLDTPGFGPWTSKSGILHVAPPQSVLDRMITLRVHLDPTGPDNAPLLIAPHSHLFGRVAEERVSETVRQCSTFVCLAERGDIWLYATPILHASDRSRSPNRRRVLQVDYSADNLPGGLEWLGV